MSVGRICSREVVLAEAGESVQAAAERMRAKNTGTLVVVDDRRKPIGLLTDRDLATRVVAPGKRPDRTYVEDIMTTEPETIADDAPIEAALARMANRGNSRLIVVGDSGILVGMVSVDDVLELLSEEMAILGGLLERQEPKSRRIVR
jgi:CBS domain-containing protein